MRARHPVNPAGGTRDASGARGSARRYGATAGYLTGVLAVSGVLTYLYFALASHSLDDEQYGALVVLWSAVFIVVSVALRPVELLLSRSVSEREAIGQPVEPALKVGAAIQLGLGLAFALVALALREPIEDRLLDGRDALYWLMLASVLALSVAYFGRGMLAGQRRFDLFAALLILDSGARLAFAAIVAAGLASGLDLIALGVLVGPLVSLSVIPFGLRGRRRANPGEEPPSRPPGGELSLGRGSKFVLALFVALLCEQTLLSTGALFVRESEGTAAAGYMFNILLVARAPVLLFQAVAASLLPHLTRLRSSGGESDEEAFRLSVRLTLIVVVGFAALVAALMAAAGPQLMQIAFHDDFGYPRLDLVLMAIGMGVYLGASTLNQALLAHGRALAVAASWVVPAIAFVAWSQSDALGPYRLIEVGFLGASLLLLATLGALYRTTPMTAGGDGAELEAMLASTEETL